MLEDWLGLGRLDKIVVEIIMLTTTLRLAIVALSLEGITTQLDSYTSS